jgi:hypothetical protein
MSRIGWIVAVTSILSLAFLALDKAKGLAQLGEEGWELVAVEGELREAIRVADPKIGGLVTNTRMRERTFYFKRPK